MAEGFRGKEPRSEGRGETIDESLNEANLWGKKDIEMGKDVEGKLSYLVVCLNAEWLEWE